MDSITAADPRLLTKVCRENFSISEIIFNMINSDEFRIVVEDLEIIISDKNRIQFDTDDYTSFDNITFEKPMYSKFEKLLSDGWVTIKSVKICCDSEFTFLLNYSKENIQYNRFDPNNANKITEYIFELDEFLPNQISAFCRKLNKSKKITVNLTINFEVGEEVTGLSVMLDEFKEVYQKFNNFKLNIWLGFTVETDYNSIKCFDSFKKNYDIIMKLRENRPKANLNVSHIVLTFYLGMTSAHKVNSYLEYASSILNIKIIKHIIIFDNFPNAYEVNLTAIKNFKYLKSFMLNSFIYVNYKTLGDLRELKELKRISFTSAELDYDWMSKYLPSSIETLTLIKTRYPAISKLKLPPNLKVLELHVNDTNKFNFNKIDFNNASGLEKIFLLPTCRESLKTKTDELVIERMEKLPESVKYVLFEGKNMENRFYPIEKLKITGVDVSGIYSNVGKKNKYLSLTAL